MSTISGTRHFFSNFIEEGLKGREFTYLLRFKILMELEKRGYHMKHELLERDWKLFEKKLLLPRWRLNGAIGAYGMLTEQNFDEISRQKGLFPFKALWMIGSIQDDLIDEIEKESMDSFASKNECVVSLRKAIFGKDRVFYQAAYACLIDYLIEMPEFKEEEKLYLCKLMADWFRFLLEQEAEVFLHNFTDYNFEYSVCYREEQNFRVGRALTAALNGIRCLDPELQALEKIIPRLSFRTQMVDDIADTGEDIAFKRPSYAIGALVSHPFELAAMETFFAQHPATKLRPANFRKIAPQSYDMLYGTFQRYGREVVEQMGNKGKMLTSIGTITYHIFPYVRDVIYSINSRYANF